MERDSPPELVFEDRPPEMIGEDGPPEKVHETTGNSGILDQIKKVYRIAATPARMSNQGLQMLTEMIPEPKTPSVAANIALNVPKTTAQVIAEFAPTFISPEVPLMGGAGKGIGMAARSAAGKALVGKIAQHVPETLKKAFTYRYGQPESYKEAAESARIAENLGQEGAASVAKPILDLPKDKQLTLGRYLRGEIADAPQELKSLADSARTAFADLGKQAVELGFLDPHTYQRNVQTYLPRLYRTKEAIKQGMESAYPSKALRMNLDRFKARKDLPDDLREAMGEILEAGYPTAKGLLQLSKAVERGKFYRQIASSPELATRDAAAAAERGWDVLPQTKRLGTLSGQWVPREVKRDLEQMIKPLEWWEQTSRKAMNAWKFGKVVLNPATHARNFMSNMILMDLGGVDLMRQPMLLMNALKQYRNIGPLFQEAKKTGLMGTDYYGAEIMEGMKRSILAGAREPNILSRSAIMAKEAANWIGQKYQGVEHIFKLAKFMDNRARGMSAKAAADDAAKWLFDYGKVSPAIEHLRKNIWGSPFITFTSKALPRVGESLATNPIKIYKYYALFDAMEQVAKKNLGLKDEDVDLIKRNSRGQVVILPLTDKDGRPLTYDLSYTLPWGDIGESGGLFGLPPLTPPSGPLKAVIEAGLNKSAYMDREIYNPSDTGTSKAAAISDFLLKSLLPPLTPGVPVSGSPFRGGHSFERLAGAAMGRPEDRYGEITRSLPMVMGEAIAGQKIRPFDVGGRRAIELQGQQRRIQELKADFTRKMSDQRLSAKEKESISKRFLKRLEEEITPAEPVTATRVLRSLRQAREQ